MAGILDQLLGGADPAAGGLPPTGGELPPSIPDPEAAAAAPAAPAGGDEVSTLKDMLGLAGAYLELPTVTEQEKVQMQKATTIFQTLLAQNEKLGEQISGTSAGQRKVFGQGG